MTEKPEYGKVPKYLETIKSQISAEKAFIAAREEELAKEQSGRTRELSQEEVDGLVRDMKIKWAKLNDAYGRLPFSPGRAEQEEEEGGAGEGDDAAREGHQEAARQAGGGRVLISMMFLSSEGATTTSTDDGERGEGRVLEDTLRGVGRRIVAR